MRGPADAAVGVTERAQPRAEDERLSRERARVVFGDALVGTPPLHQSRDLVEAWVSFGRLDPHDLGEALRFDRAPRRGHALVCGLRQHEARLASFCAVTESL